MYLSWDTIYSKPDWQSTKHTKECHARAREQRIWKWIQNKTSNPVYYGFFFIFFDFSVHLFLVFRHMYFPHPLFFFSPHQIKPCHRKGEIDWWIRGVLECNSVISLLSRVTWMWRARLCTCKGSHLLLMKVPHHCMLENRICAMWRDFSESLLCSFIMFISYHGTVWRGQYILSLMMCWRRMGCNTMMSLHTVLIVLKNPNNL